MKLVAGSYERFLWGWRLEKGTTKKRSKAEVFGEQVQERGDQQDQSEREIWRLEKGRMKKRRKTEGLKEQGRVQGNQQDQLETERGKGLKLIFSYPAHLGPIKCIASWGSVLATGGADDTIKIFDSSAQRDMGTLMHHTGAISALVLYGPAESPYPHNLLSGSDDGTVCIWDTESWLLYKTMKGHKRGVHDLTIHPSGHVALSVGRDSHLKMYNLLKGRQSFTTKLPLESTLVRFSPKEGSIYSASSENIVSVHNAEDGRELFLLQHGKRVLCMHQQEDGVLFTGGEDSTIRAWDIKSAELAASIPNAHSSRIRGLYVLNSVECSPFMVATASSDGFVRVWDIRFVKKSMKEAAPKPLMEDMTRARLTCLVGCSLKNGPVTSKDGTQAHPVMKCTDSEVKQLTLNDSLKALMQKAGTSS